MKKIIIICLLILLITGGYWLYKNPHKIEEVSDSVSEVIAPDFSKKNGLTTIKLQEKTDLVEIDVKYPQTGFGSIDDKVDVIRKSPIYTTEVGDKAIFSILKEAGYGIKLIEAFLKEEFDNASSPEHRKNINSSRVWLREIYGQI